MKSIGCSARVDVRRSEGADAASRRYRVGAFLELGWLLAQLSRRSRPLGRDAAEAIARSAPDALVLGREHIPVTGPFVLVMNHYERAGLGVWWSAALGSAAVWRARNEEPPLRWLIATDIPGLRVGGLAPPSALVQRVLAGVARTYGAILVPPPGEWRGRAQALLRARAYLHGAAARPVALTPETSAHGLAVHPWRNAGAAVSMLSAGRIPVLPVGVREDAARRLVARFGEPWVPPAGAPVRDARVDLAAELAVRIDALLTDASAA